MLMERLKLVNLWQHENENNIIHCNQHGFSEELCISVNRMS